MYTFVGDREIPERQLTFAGLDEQARGVAALLLDRGFGGQAVLLLYPPGLEFTAAFFGCLYAGCIAVPAPPTSPNRPPTRLLGIAADCRPVAVLTSSALLGRRQQRATGALEGAAWLATDVDSAVHPLPRSSWRPPPVSSNAIALLQYTSGSTGSPKGVALTHANLIENQRVIYRAFGHSCESVVVGWLPVYHDMGLIGNILQTVYAGAQCVLLSPLAFLQRPLRWLEAISHHGATTSGAPNFAFELCARRADLVSCRGLDLSRWDLAFCGAEPNRADTLDRFVGAFAPCGFRPDALYPCYGLAEATLLVSGGPKGSGPQVTHFDGPALDRRRVLPAPAGAPHSRALVSCGPILAACRAVIVGPDSGELCSPDEVGELWLSGPSVARGYWGGHTADDTFAAYLPDGSGPFLRTGDLGFFHSGHLYLAGRLKDLIIVRGRNHYAQDIEATVGRSHQALEAGRGAAFGVESGGEERLVVVHETDRHTDPAEFHSVIETLREAVVTAHELAVYSVLLVPPGAIPRTSSGKVRRHACRAEFLRGGFRPLASWRAGQ